MVKKKPVKKTNPSTIQQMEDVMKASRIPAGDPLGTAIVEMSKAFDRMERIVTTGIQGFSDRLDTVEFTVGTLADKEQKRQRSVEVPPSPLDEETREQLKAAFANTANRSQRYQGHSDGFGHSEHLRIVDKACQPPLSVPLAVDELQTRISELEKTAILLIDRLMPVLSTAGPRATVAGSSLRPDVPVSISEQISEETKRVSSVCGQLADALDRLQL